MPLPRRLIPLLLLLSIPAAVMAAPALSLEGAVKRAFEKNPEIAFASWELPAADARVWQASLRPNPELSLSLDDFTGSGAYKNADQTEVTLEYRQLFEIGGKRPARIAAARGEKRVAELELAARRLLLAKETALAFIDALALQELAKIDLQSLALSEKALPEITKRVEAGRASKVEEKRAQIAVANARLDVRRTERDLSAARFKLAALMGESKPSFGFLTGNLERTPALPPKPLLLQRTERHPDLLKAKAETLHREATLYVEKTKATPSLTAFAGPRWIREGNDVSLAAGISIPLPLWDRNQGAIAEAESRIGQAQEREREASLRVSNALLEAWEKLKQISEEIELLRREILPASAEVVEGIDQSFQAGQMSSLDLLEARRTFYQSRISLIRALTVYHRTVAEIESLTPAGAPTLSATDQPAKRK